MGWLPQFLSLNCRLQIVDCRLRLSPICNLQSTIYNLKWSPVMLFLFTVELQRAPQPFAQRHLRAPAQTALDQSVVGVVIADIDRFAIGWEGHDLVAPVTV